MNSRRIFNVLMIFSPQLRWCNQLDSSVPAYILCACVNASHFTLTECSSTGVLNNMVPSVLIVDDEKHTREGLQQALQDDYDVSVAGSADEAFNLMDAQEFDVIVTDLRMPGKSGLKRRPASSGRRCG